MEKGATVSKSVAESIPDRSISRKIFLDPVRLIDYLSFTVPGGIYGYGVIAENGDAKKAAILVSILLFVSVIRLRH